MTPDQRRRAREEEKQWTNAGLTRPDGRLQRPGFAAQWATPERVWLDADQLRWDRGGSSKEVVPPADLLDLFVRLAGASAERVLTFARTYGVIYLCEQHKQPISHLRQVGGTDLVGNDYPCEPLGGYSHPYVPTAYYSDFATQCRSVLNIAKRLGDGVAGTYEDWYVLNPSYARTPAITPTLGWNVQDVDRQDTPPDELADIDRETLVNLLNVWLDIADVRFRIDWSASPAPQFRVEVRTLFGALVTSLVMALTRGGLATCSACGRAYTPKRHPAAGRRNYCNDASCLKTRATDATRASRARKSQREQSDEQ